MRLTEESFISGPSSSSSSRPIHVYLSFKGDDETCRFTDRLWAALETNDLNTFWDDKKLDPGDSIFLPPHFLKPIRQSNISIVVFSKNYASSIWCLEELSEIAARIHETRYAVFPIFYDVHPSEVQKQSNSFEKAFAEHEQRFPANLRKLHNWRSATKQVADLFGWHVLIEPKPQVIDDIIKEVKRKMRELVYADVDLVGMQSRVREVEELLDLGSKDETRVVGICGMGGVGKSTLARVLHDRISQHFDTSYLVLNAIEFCEPLMVRNRKRTLIVLDCVDIGNILLSLVTSVRENQLVGGSRIIITTRDEGVFKMFEKHYIYKIKLLTKNEALLLFCRKAFKCDFPMRGYEEQINSVLQYANGLPLAIVVMGSLLYNTRVSEWRCALVDIKKVASRTIMNVLRKSFDDLDCDGKQMFLDIACFFTGKEIKFVEGILDSTHPMLSDYDHPAKNCVQVLIEKSLMTIIYQKVHMHGLVQEMGREIVQCTSPGKPEEWSRLWDFDDVYGILQNDKANYKVEAIVLELENSHVNTLRVEGLSEMVNLKLRIFRNVKFSGVLRSLTSKLQYISWHQYPFTSLPSIFYAHCLRELVLTDSGIACIWNNAKEFQPWRSQRFPSLRNLNLSGSKDLTKMPDFGSFFPGLERLDLEGCVKLSKLHVSIGYLSTLKFLNLRNCVNLFSIPNRLFSLPSLEVINLACCFKFAYCLKFCPPEELSEGETIEQSLSWKRQKLC